MRRFVLILLLLASLSSSFALPADSVILKPKPVYGKEARIISLILDSYHYRKISLNDSLSEAILMHYENELDNNRRCFLASDIDSFNKYKDKIDDYTQKEDVSIAYEIMRSLPNVTGNA